MSQAKEKNFVSCVLYLHNEGTAVNKFLERLCSVMRENFEKFEIVCVNDGSTDDTPEFVKRFVDEQCGEAIVSLITLSYYQGVEAAMNAGCDLAVGDYIFEFDKCQFDFEPSLIMEVYNRTLQGYDVVAAAPKYGVPITSKLFYMLYNLENRRYRLRHERFRIISRRVVNRVNQMNIYIPYRKALYANCGLKMDTLVYDNKAEIRRGPQREEREIRSTLALDTLIIFTSLLERFSMAVSVILFGVLIVMFGYLIYSIFSPVRPVEGWLSIMSLMSFGFFMLSVMLTLIFKYLSLILNINFKRQRYVVEGVEKLTK